ncbi:MAG: hypothetical protein KDA87_03610 [Planctomycetales bacterium]|nr:hypothetical protein [Planctomycetales bacterium]
MKARNGFAWLLGISTSLGALLPLAAEEQSLLPPLNSTSGDVGHHREYSASQLYRLPLLGPDARTASQSPSSARKGDDSVARLDDSMSLLERYRLASKTDRSQWDEPADQDVESAFPTDRTEQLGVVGQTAPLSANVVDSVLKAVQRSIDMGNRGAVFAAREELDRAILTIARNKDALSGGNQHVQALNEGLRALEETSDFSQIGDIRKGVAKLPDVVDGHRTRILRQADLESMSYASAAQQYLAFAESRLSDALKGENVSADALVALGKLQPHLGADSDELTVDNRSLVFFRAAARIAPTNLVASHELAVLCAKRGDLQEAKRLFQWCAQLPNCEPVVWKNLATVHARLGETQYAQSAQSRFYAAQQAIGGFDNSGIDWVSQEEFTRRSVASTPMGPAVTRATSPAANVPPPAYQNTPQPEVRYGRFGRQRSQGNSPY